MPSPARTSRPNSYYSAFTPARKTGGGKGRPSEGLALLCKQAQCNEWNKETTGKLVAGRTTYSLTTKA
eukprot:1273152-Amphidinium_carterae.1